MVSEGIFAFKLAPVDSSLFLGGTDSSLYIGSTEFHPIDPSSGHWQVPGTAAHVGSGTPNAGFDAIIDSGTTLAYGPVADVQKFYSAIPGSQSLGGGAWSYPCDSLPPVSFSWNGGQTWQITPEK